MRIVSGTLKGKKIFYLESTTTRPLRDLVKESIFNVINHSSLIEVAIDNSNILDLYSGIGSFGIECLSRNAKNVTFIENNKETLRLLNKNIENLSLLNKSKIFNNTVEKFLDNSPVTKFDIFFFDPPFKDNKYIGEIKRIKDMKLYNKKNLVILHRDKKSVETFEDVFSSVFIKQYGRSKIIFGTFA
ncbi:MAG: 16S rRNA (guanine966-N2)-methyltransferase [Pelagibacterales bacterium]|nr:16S rRNA (guanine966-N2)-methyltransferase [Pelagibacterales bacterium]